MTEDTKEPKTQEQRSDRKLKIIIVILAVLLLLTGGTMIFWGGVPFFSAFAPNNGGSTSQGAGLVVDSNASEYVEPEQAPGVKIPGFGSMTIPANTKFIEGANLYNPIENEGWYYLTFAIGLLKADGTVSEILYQSQLIPPNNLVKDITLSRGLPKGKYDAVFLVQPYRIADKSPTNNANLKFTLIVE